MVGVAENSELGVIIFAGFGEVIGGQEFLVFPGYMCFGGGSSFFLILSMNSFFIPVGDEGAWIRVELPCPLGMFLLKESSWV